MPKIRQIVNEPGVSGRLPAQMVSSAAFGGATAEGTAMLGNAAIRTADFMQDNEDRADVSNVHAQMAKARADWTIQLAERARTAPAGDDTFAQKFSEDFDNYALDAQNIAKTRAGQEAFKVQAGELRGALLQRAAAFQAESVAVKAKADYGLMQDAYQNTLMNDPTQYASIRESMLNALNDPNGQFARLSPQDRTALARATEEGLASAQIRGLIVNGAPELAKKKLTGGELDTVLDAKNKVALLSSADVAIKSKDEEANRKRTLDEIDRKQRQEVAMKDALAKIIDPKANGVLTDKMILANPDLDASHQQHLIDYRRARIKEMQAESGNRPNPNKVRELMLEIHATADDPRKTYNYDKIMAAYAKNEINTNELVFLRREVDQMKDGTTQPFQKDVQGARNLVYSTFTRSLEGTVNPGKAADAAYRFTADLNAAIEQKRAKNEDPRVLLQPGNKEYMLAPERLQSYMGTPSMVLRDATAAVTNRNPNPVKRVIATDPKTGAQVEFKDGKWQPIQE